MATRFEDVLGGFGRFIDRVCDDVAWKWRLSVTGGGLIESITAWVRRAGEWATDATNELSWKLRKHNVNFSLARGGGGQPLLTSRHAAVASLILVPMLLCVLISWRLNRVPPPEPFTEQELALISQLASRSSASTAPDRSAIAAAAHGSRR